jgi:hypothetical protein
MVRFFCVKPSLVMAPYVTLSFKGLNLLQAEV